MQSKTGMLQRNMSTNHRAFSDLSDDQLLNEVHRLAAAERGATAALIRSLIELDARPHLFLRDGCSSLFVYCTRVLHLSESATYTASKLPGPRDDFPSCSMRWTTVR